MACVAASIQKSASSHARTAAATAAHAAVVAVEPLPPRAAEPAAAGDALRLDASTVVFFQQQLERVLAFMRTVDARLDQLERACSQLGAQQERIVARLNEQQARGSAASHAGGLGGSAGNVANEGGCVAPPALCALTASLTVRSAQHLSALRHFLAHGR